MSSAYEYSGACRDRRMARLIPYINPWAILLSLRELEPPTRAALAVLLTLFHARVARQGAAVTQCGFQRRVIFEQGAGEAHDNCPGLSGLAAAAGVDQHVHLAAGVGDFQRAEDGLAIHFLGEV